MSVIILGAAGNLGSQLEKTFSANLSAAWDRRDFDFLDFAELSRRLKELSPSLIINAAAYNAVDKCESDDEELALAKRLNVELPAQLADFCLENDISLMHYSSDYVFGANNRFGPAYSETDLPAPVNAYGQTKLDGEKELARRALKGLKYYIIRTSKLFGPPGTSEYTKPSFFDLMIQLSEEKKKLEVVDAELSCFTYTPDLATASFALWQDRAPRGIYHLINSGPSTWYEAALYLFKKLDKEIELEAVSSDFWPRPAKRPQFSVLQNTRRAHLRSWQEALDDYLENNQIK
jgi:dTDP-4-dehydrorhamnose reductase